MSSKSLFSGEPVVYSFPAAAKSAAGRGNPSLTMATQHAPSVFFYVAALAYQFLAQWCLYLCRFQAMVAQAGLTSVRPVHIVTGISTPVWATTHKRGNFGGGCYQLTMEAIYMATTLTPLHPQFTYLFAAVRRAEVSAPVCRLRTVAANERAARREFARDYVLLFAGRLPAGMPV
ncbi:host cell division inhibitor Icd-like protein [Rouxiella badensis]|uniref:host cell division inhibitor Icd-like protein n=1 Tax=Rouxiella badensis TaxID=1646377 RepID=UPI001B5E2AEA|nr:host cell division inhibitor Icd-like protein [Rouxiella badensis]MCC3747030.1 host cell division inhibitor Icd-like protein [Rouxiella badensis]